MSLPELRLLLKAGFVAEPYFELFDNASPHGKFAILDPNGDYVKSTRYVFGKLVVKCSSLADLSEDGEEWHFDAECAFILSAAVGEKILEVLAEGNHNLELHMACAMPFRGVMPETLDVHLMGDPGRGGHTLTMHGCAVSSLFLPAARAALGVTLTALTTSMQVHIG